jgi:DNA-binding transcriptional LysR family regulator
MPFLKANPAVQVRFLLLDRVVNLVEEGVDIAVRIGRLPDSSLISVKVGEVGRVTCASPEYLAHGPPLRKPSDLAMHDCIAVSQITPNDVWSFAPGRGRKARRHVRVRPRLIVNGVDAAIASGVAGGGVTCVLSYQVVRELRSRSLVRVLRAFEPPPLPVQVVYPETRPTARAQAFVDRLIPALRAELGA